MTNFELLKNSEVLTLIYIRTLLTQITERSFLAVALCRNRSKRLTWKNGIVFHISKKTPTVYQKTWKE